jgi:DNA mismatch endonuclease, patch repair protein
MAEQEPFSRTRSRNMAAIRGKDTAPELAVRRILHAMGLRFHLHRNDLPDRPDIFLPRHRTVVFVHVCFWHRHEGCQYTTNGKNRGEFWLAKFESNVSRDRRQKAELERLGWRVLVVWGCELRKPEALRDRIRKAFHPTHLA